MWNNPHYPQITRRLVSRAGLGLSVAALVCSTAGTFPARCRRALLPRRSRRHGVPDNDAARRGSRQCHGYYGRADKGGGCPDPRRRLRPGAGRLHPKPARQPEDSEHRHQGLRRVSPPKRPLPRQRQARQLHRPLGGERAPDPRRRDRARRGVPGPRECPLWGQRRGGRGEHYSQDRGRLPQGIGLNDHGNQRLLQTEGPRLRQPQRLLVLAFGSDLDTDGYRRNNSLHAKDLLGNFGFEVSDRFKLSLSTGTHTDDYGQPGTLYWSQLRSGTADPTNSTHLNDTASTNDSFSDLVPEIRLWEDIVLSLGASYRDRHTASFYDYGFGTYYDSKSQLQTYALTPKVAVDKPNRRHEERLRHRYGFRQIPHDGELLGYSARPVAVDERHQQEGPLLLCGSRRYFP